MSEQRQPLAGLVVIDCSRVLAGPYCAQLLGDLGATVIKVEQPGTGDETRAWGPPFVGGESAYFFAANRNKQSLALDLARPTGQAVLRRLLAQASVLIENYKLGTLEKWGLSDEELWTLNPRLVHTAISAFGTSGPLAAQPGYDLLMQAFGGMMSITGEPAGDPMKVGVAMVDVLTSLYAATATLAAVRLAEQTGQGQRVDCALLDAAVAGLVNVGSSFLATERPPQRWGNAHATIVPYQLFQASDGPFMLAVGNDRQWRRCCEVIGVAELADDPLYQTNPQRVANRVQLVALLQERFGEQSVDQWIPAFEAAGVPAAPVNTLPEVFAHPQVQHQQLVEEVAHPTAGIVRLLGFPFKLSHTPAEVRHPPPLLGEQTDSILRSAGYSEAEIAELRADGII